MRRTLALCLILLLLTGCGDAQPNKETKTVYAMDTVMTLTAYGGDTEAALEAARHEIVALEYRLSATEKDSDIYRLNDAGTARVSDETAQLVQRALEASELTQGDFDPTMGWLMELWGFRSNRINQVPDQDAIQESLRNTGYEKVRLTGDLVTIPQGCKLDLGGIAKGYTAEQVLSAMAAEGVESAIISLGGNVGTLGLKPDGSEWTVAVENPDKSGDYLATLSLGAGYYAITSGAYERYFEQDGKRYHHILDPKTGYPAESGLESVTIVSQDGTLADALSTALFVKGFDGAVGYWRAHAEEFEMVLVTAEGLFATPGLTIASEREIITLEVAP